MIKLIQIQLLLEFLVLASCNKDTHRFSFSIGGLIMENYPKTDGSASVDPLNRLIACKLLGKGYNWVQYD